MIGVWTKVVLVRFLGYFFFKTLKLQIFPGVTLFAWRCLLFFFQNQTKQEKGNNISKLTTESSKHKHILQKHLNVSSGAQSCLTLCDPMDCSPPTSSVHGILQARILEWVAISFSMGYSWPRDQPQVSCIMSRFFLLLSHQGSPEYRTKWPINSKISKHY